jgi:hypothetical protein
MNNKLLTDTHKLEIAKTFMESLKFHDSDRYYVYVGEHVPSTNTQIASANNNERSVYIDQYRNMIMGKKVGQNDAALMIRNIPYISNTVYDMYDDIDSDLNEKDYYVIVDEGSNFHVYKCLDNNGGRPSLIEPEYGHIVGSNTALYQTSDGYRWKYMYTVDSSTKQKFATSEYFPVIESTNVQSYAVGGAIDIIKIEDGGKGYDNYVTGTFSAENIKYSGSATLYEISNTSASTLNGFYDGCLLYISSGSGAGAYRTITQYYIESGKKIIGLDSEFDINNAPAIGSTYQIYPEVKIYGDGTQSVNAVARALVNSQSSNSIYRIDILERGADYKYFTANVVANSVVLVDKEAQLRPIYSPIGGHGSNQAKELGATRTCISVKYANNESNTFLTTNDFRQIGLLKNPLFANVVIVYDTVIGSYITGEKIYKIDPVQLATNATVTTDSDSITYSGGAFTSQMAAGDLLYLKSSDNLGHQIATVVTVSNDTHIKITTNAFFSCTETFVYSANVSTNGFVYDIEASNIAITNVGGDIGTGDILVGVDSGAWMNVSNIVRNNKQKTFNTFIQLNKYDATLSTLSFEQDELVYQSNQYTGEILANASLHSVITVSGPSIEMYCSNQVGRVTNTYTIIGNTSGATATINNVYSPELVFGSGKILYFENIEPVARTTDQSETFKLIFEF